MSSPITRRQFLGDAVNLGVAVAATSLIGKSLGADIESRSSDSSRARGYVFHDRHGDGVRRADCPGVAGVRISNGKEIVRTDSEGRYSIPIAPGQILFVIKPSGWRLPVNENNLPQFYYIHKPEGTPQWRPESPLSDAELSPENYFAGSSPTGPLPSSVDFPLTPQEESTKFRCLAMADTQVGGLYQLHWMNRQTMREIAALRDISFGFILGDIANVGNLSMFDPLNQSLRGCKFPCHMVVGNHDQNLMVPDNSLTNETFQAEYGPDYYAFDYAHVSFLVLNNVFRDPYDSAFRYDDKGMFNFHRSRYHKGMTDRQWAFLDNYLQTVPHERPLVIAMHIPMDPDSTSAVERAFDRRLLQMISGRPQTLSITGHWHSNIQMFLGREHGFDGPSLHHQLISVAVRGNGYRGPYDDLRIPANMGLDGCPAGYNLLNFDGPNYTIDYKASRRGDDLQMHLYLQEEVLAHELEAATLVANVFTNSDRSQVKMRIASGPWHPMTRGGPTPYDPAVAEIIKVQGEDEPGKWGRRIPDKTPFVCRNLWQANLPADLAPGMHQVTVQHTDMYGRIFEDRRCFLVKTETT